MADLRKRKLITQKCDQFLYDSAHLIALSGRVNGSPYIRVQNSPHRRLSQKLILPWICSPRKFAALMSLRYFSFAFVQWFLEDLHIQKVQLRGRRDPSKWWRSSSATQGQGRDSQHLLGDGVRQLGCPRLSLHVAHSRD